MLRYRNNFSRDFIKDLIDLQRKLQENTSGEIEAVDLDIFEKITWCMAKTADDTIPDIEKWLDQFETFDIMQALPEIMELLVSNMEQVNSKKRTK